MHVWNSSPAWLADDAASEVKAEARAFCLRMINEFFGIGYTPAWHSDLDSLLKTAPENWFSNGERGSFLLVRDDGGRIVAAGGLYALEKKPSTRERFRDRYRDADAVCQIARVYLEPGARRKGMGSSVVAALETRARELGYITSYLHADAETPDTLRFWRSQGYSEFGRFSYPSPRGTDSSVDFEKSLQEDAE
ncbi:Acetyltransferase (GNAT) family protein [Agrobacterium fabrum]|uniref:GNAT family N-acetyltransferase n=1 Tax=Agrobacterium fabrum TaxID=1176649 RepID=UPI000889178D|nr:GNAT family N-acetyltransferase [Agrobacterium fabrum]MDH6297631.1 GNAT superfamily N-acetyltransferase [Agrobacterium fabrum]SDB68341.1 Acetyltransferase (GNAT) family protein [Agrobacterium fabrum]SER56984.1 Acetyltransferase (GNAT) family protein [Agrobacterium fabrum]